MESLWQRYSNTEPALLKYKKSYQFSDVHLDIIDGKYIPISLEKGEPVDYFEIEIGNQICYSAPMEIEGPYLKSYRINGCRITMKNLDCND